MNPTALPKHAIGSPAEPAAKVAPIKATYPGLRRECAELGVCHAFEPPCSLCAKHQTRAAELDGEFISVADLARWGALAMLLLLSAAALGLAAGYLFAYLGA